MITRRSAPTPVAESIPVPPKFPELPADVLKRFPSLSEWQTDGVGRWSTRLVQSLSQQNRTVSQNIAENKTANTTLRVTFGEFAAEIREEVDTIVNEQGAQARRIVTVSAMAGVNSNISVQGTAPVGPAPNDYWIDDSDPLEPITYQWNGVAWEEVTTPISYAGVAQEQTARVTADGFLSGKYTLTVIAGNVVTGMNITSSTGGGTDISSVIFRATDFQIYNGVVGKTMFSVSGTDVNLAGVLTVSTSGKVYTGVGTYANNNTPFYVDSSSNFSLGTGLTWNGTTLTIAGNGTFTGTITASAGTIGGWVIGVSTLSKNNAILDSAGQLVLGTVNDVVVLSATDATYRVWIGNATAGSATFRVTKGGVMTATNGVFSGTVTSTAGTIGGFTLGATSFTAGSGSTYVEIQNSGSPFLKFGAGSNYVATYTQTGMAVTGSTGVGTLGVILGTSGGNNLLGVYDNSNNPALTFNGSVGNLAVTNAFLGGLGSAGSPTHSFASATNYGMYQSGSVLGFSTGGTLRAYLDTSYNFVVSNGTVNSLVAVDTVNSRMTVGTSTNHSLQFLTNSALTWLIGTDTNLKSNGGDIRKISSDGWGPKMFDGTNTYEIRTNAGTIEARINGGAPILLG